MPSNNDSTASSSSSPPPYKAPTANADGHIAIEMDAPGGVRPNTAYRALPPNRYEPTTGMRDGHCCQCYFQLSPGTVTLGLVIFFVWFIFWIMDATGKAQVWDNIRAFRGGVWAQASGSIGASGVGFLFETRRLPDASQVSVEGHGISGLQHCLAWMVTSRLTRFTMQILK
ncbi:hypothetical protein C8A01DRAFT_36414 [Parachaetomium inaequale]|uniref:Uncharacterized protein n=1 Tax=Parachaetomium inaequale TaxID=2588326 RepID=A0AAN6PI71_9PEZI|nr:hypothetical protein C8A01DRAFT_36414 [Parachaetomium inaequale]